MHIASVASNYVCLPDSNNLYLERQKMELQNQSWALILEPVAGDAEEWKWIGIARIADGLIDG